MLYLAGYRPCATFHSSPRIFANFADCCQAGVPRWHSCNHTAAGALTPFQNEEIGNPADAKLVPRIRSSHFDCRESDCELRVQSGTRIIELLVSFDSEVRIETCGKLGRTSESGH